MSRWLLALDLIGILLYLIAWGLALVGLGSLGLIPLHRSWGRAGKVALMPLLALAWLSGLLLNYALVLAVQNLHLALGVGGGLALLGLGYLGFLLYRLHREGRLERGSGLAWVGAGLLILLYTIPILTQPLEAWDARSIWFFHARMIYVAKALGPGTGFQHPSLATFSHPDYPNLIPALAAQIATLRGYWNEYLPKAALLLALVPAFLGLFALGRWRLAFAFLVITLPFGLRGWLWNGYMDGHLALYLALALLYLGRALDTEAPEVGFLGLGALALLPNLKNEGLLAALTLVLAWVLLGWLTRRQTAFSACISRCKDWRTWAIVGWMFLPLLFWTLEKHLLGLTSDLALGSAGSITRLLNRLEGGSLDIIMRAAYPHLHGGLLLVLFPFTVARLRRLTSPPPVQIALLAGGLYFLGLLIIYLSTPYDLGWHLRASIERTLLGVSAANYVAAYGLLDVLEQPSDEPCPPT